MKDSMKKIKIYGITESFEKIDEYNYKECDLIQLRDKSSTENNLLPYIEKLRLKYPLSKIVLNYYNFSILDKKDSLLIDGVHYQISNIGKREKRRKYDFLSCHNEEDLKIALNNNFDFVTLSPVFKTESHPNEKRILGVEKFNSLVGKYRSLKIFGLGGLNSKNIGFLKSFGIAGISNFKRVKRQ
ncbi:MAG: hypothetical protein CR982_02650 [Candidatus Cloacimonadota bacterium]|nr:MAG: hypothetical protein CR982_02650 [Candidatus Cloacimonadota bacterium]PIE79329.1 MAG: hypothetical protein CSA15_03505 [Candidatus Delongbacteria bacterium]